VVRHFIWGSEVVVLKTSGNVGEPKVIDALTEQLKES